MPACWRALPFDPGHRPHHSLLAQLQAGHAPQVYAHHRPYAGEPLPGTWAQAIGRALRGQVPRACADLTGYPLDQFGLRFTNFAFHGPFGQVPGSRLFWPAGRRAPSPEQHLRAHTTVRDYNFFLWSDRKHLSPVALLTADAYAGDVDGLSVVSATARRALVCAPWDEVWCQVHAIIGLLALPSTDLMNHADARWARPALLQNPRDPTQVALVLILPLKAEATKLLFNWWLPALAARVDLDLERRAEGSHYSDHVVLRRLLPVQSVHPDAAGGRLTVVLNVPDLYQPDTWHRVQGRAVNARAPAPTVPRRDGDNDATAVAPQSGASLRDEVLLGDAAARLCASFLPPGTGPDPTMQHAFRLAQLAFPLLWDWAPLVGPAGPESESRANSSVATTLRALLVSQRIATQTPGGVRDRAGLSLGLAAIQQLLTRQAHRLAWGHHPYDERGSTLPSAVLCESEFHSNEAEASCNTRLHLRALLQPCDYGGEALAWHACWPAHYRYGTILPDEDEETDGVSPTPWCERTLVHCDDSCDVLRALMDTLPPQRLLDAANGALVQSDLLADEVFTSTGRRNRALVDPTPRGELRRLEFPTRALWQAQRLQYAARTDGRQPPSYREGACLALLAAHYACDPREPHRVSYPEAAVAQALLNATVCLLRDLFVIDTHYMLDLQLFRDPADPARGTTDETARVRLGCGLSFEALTERAEGWCRHPTQHVTGTGRLVWDVGHPGYDEGRAAVAVKLLVADWVRHRVGRTKQAAVDARQVAVEKTVLHGRNPLTYTTAALGDFDEPRFAVEELAGDYAPPPPLSEPEGGRPPPAAPPAVHRAVAAATAAGSSRAAPMDLTSSPPGEQ